MPAPVVVAPEARANYYEAADGAGGLLAIVKSPMGLMMLMMVGMVFLLPKMMDGIDPEELKQMQKEMAAKQKDNPLNKLLGGQ